ncbi:MAG: VWA domain-containing protein [Lewinellaceae bacterium]|jgi:Ca-activated chloride channel family protein|nr:VWA domain-containing protein [Lewinellaceae bacterium]
MLGFRFSDYKPDPNQSTFDRLFKIFQELMLYTSGDVTEALAWLNELDREYKLTNDEYGMGDFLRELEERGYIRRDGDGQGGMGPTRKLEISLRQKSLDDIFGDLKKAKSGKHNTTVIGQGDEFTADVKPYEFGDSLDNLAVTNSLKNAYINHGIDEFNLTQDDLEVHETYSQSQMSSVLMIDISHSMILYGEDRITPAKKVALALAEFIQTRYPKDTLDILVFGDDAWPIELKEVPYLQVGPYHTNTVAGLELALDILKRRRNPNKQIFMITDGKPTCLKIGKNYYKNSFGLDRKIVNRCLNLAMRCKKLNVPITTFMIARDPYLVRFVEAFTQTNNGKAFYSSLQGLGSFVLENYKKRKRKK